MKALRLGGILTTLFLMAALAGRLLPPEHAHNLAQTLCQPSASHWLGCDAFGRDLGREILSGAWTSLQIALVVTLANMLIGLVVGTVAELGPAWLSGLITRVIDSFLAFPGLLLAILLASIMPHSERTVIVALVLTGWTGRARFCRALAAELAQRPFIEAAWASGASPLRIVRTHLWPAMLGQLTIQAALSMGAVILAEASLSFLGLGAADNASWGYLIAEGRDYLVEAPHLTLLPGLVFVSTILAFNVLAEGLRQRLDRV